MPPKPTAIAVVEPQMENLFHAPFNAALLHAVALAYPAVTVSFRSLPGHTEAVRGLLARYAPEIVERIAWRPIQPTSGSSLPARWRANSRLLREVLKPGERVLFSSVSRMQLLQLKRILKPGDEVRAVLHGDLDRIEQPVTERFPASLFALQNVLLSAHRGDLRYVLLSESIRAHLPPRFNSVMCNAAVMDHPYHFPALQPAPPGPIVFGIFGNTGEAYLLEEVARAVKALQPDLRFSVVGFLANAETVARIAPLAEGAGHTPIPQKEFIRRTATVTYCLWLSPPDTFRLRASGTLLDALAYGKPLVYTANPFIDAYFQKTPGIGVRCETLAEVPAAILHLAAQHTPARYAAAQAAIAHFRTRFTPEALAAHLPATLDWPR